MCNEGACAHGSRTAPATDFAVPHDSAVPTDAECTRVCNTHHPGDTQAPASGYPCPLEVPAPPPTHAGIGVLDLTAEPSENHHNPDTHPRLRCNDTPQTRRRTGPISSRSTTDLDTGCYRSQGGTGPISTRNTTDLGEKCEIGVDDRIEAQYNTSPPVHAAVTRDDATPPCRWPQISSSSTAGTAPARRTASTSSSGS